MKNSRLFGVCWLRERIVYLLSYTIYINVIFGPLERKTDFTVFQTDNICAVVIAFPLATFIWPIKLFYDSKKCIVSFDVHGTVHRNINLIERTNKMQPCSRIYYSNVS
jgi:hypothetical protein